MGTSTVQEGEQAQERFDDEGGRQAPGESAPGRLSAVAESALKDLMVLTADGQALGRVASVEVDIDDWRVVSIEVRLNREIQQALGVRRHVFRGASLTIPTGQIQSVRDAIILSRTTAELRHTESDTSAALH